MLDPPTTEAIVCIKVTPRYTAQVYNSWKYLPVFFSGAHILDGILWKDK